MSQQAAAKAISETCEEIKKMLLQKNLAYGNSAFEPVRLFSKSSTDEQINVRLDDKLSRLARGESAGEDVVLDLIGYLVIKRAQKKYLRYASVVASNYTESKSNEAGQTPDPQ